MSSAPTGLVEALADRYRLLDVVGRGGMATVYRAHDIRHDRPVALKVLHDDLAASLGPERFKREILTAARLQHPHILGVLDSGEDAGRLWFTMPFVSGESLRDRLKREGKLSVEAALVVVREAAQALAYAHKQGVIHRDIKPENILLTEDGSTLVADFGIARAIGDRSFEQGLTQTGAAIGTPTYMAPEQATGETVLDERVDQYALAAVLYELLTGQPPFTGLTVAALMAARFTTSVTPVRTHRGEVSAEVDAAVQRALALKPVDRYPNITDFARAVAPNVVTPPQFGTLMPARAPRPRRRPGVWAAVGLLVVAAGTAAAVWSRGASGAEATGPVRIAVLPLQNLGDSADAYFADGMTDELRAKLVGLPGLEVIARASSVIYTKTDKTPAQIAEELGVRYLLTGTLRYEHGPDGRSTVRVRPELVEVSGKGPATSKWQAAFDEPFTSAAALQAKIAGQVAAELRLTLGTADRTRLAALPTTVPAAYDAYLRGLSNFDQSPAGLRRRAADLEQAVALDPAFAEAWASLATQYALLYANVSATPDLRRRARDAAAQARRLAPGTASEHLAWGNINSTIQIDNQAAEREYRAAVAAAPGDAASLSRLASFLDALGRFEEARPLFQQAIQLDPLHWRPWGVYGSALLFNRRYGEARAPLERAAALQPASQQRLLLQVLLHVGMGDLERARATIRDAYSRFTPAELDTYLAIYLDNGWLLDSVAQQRVLDAPLELFDGERGTQLFVRAQILHARGDLRGSRQAALQALPFLAAEAAKQPDDPQWFFLRGLAAALAGRTAEAKQLVAEGGRNEQRGVLRSYLAEVSARVHTLTGQYDRAFDAMERSLAVPGHIGRGHYALNPMYAPLRSLPRYQQIMATASAQETR